MVLTGTYPHSIDAKHRVAIPADIRAQVCGATRRSDGKSYWYVTLGDPQALCLYTDDQFEKRAAELDDSERGPEEILRYESLLFSLSRRVEMDKNGRVRLPESLLKMTGLKTEVVLIGVKDHLEIRDRTAWQEHVQKVLAEQPQLLMNPRRAMRRPTAPESSTEQGKESSN